MKTSRGSSSGFSAPATSNNGLAARASGWPAYGTSWTATAGASPCAARRAAAQPSRCACRSVSSSRKVLLSEVVETSAAVADTASRSAKVERVAATLQRLTPDEAAIGVAFLSSQLRQRHIGLGYAPIRDLPEPAESPSLSLIEVDTALEAIGGVTGRDPPAQPRRHPGHLFSRATSTAQDFLRPAVVRGAPPGGPRTGIADVPPTSLGHP